MDKTSLKVSTLVLCPSEKIRKTPRQNNRQQLDKLNMIDTMNKAIREKRYLDTVKNLAVSRKTDSLRIGIEEYNDIYKQMIERCRCYFTSEYGKSEDDYRRFVDGCTKTFETAIETEHHIKDRMRYYKTEVIMTQCEENEKNTLKRTTLTAFSQFKSVSTKHRGKQYSRKIKTTVAKSKKYSKKSTRAVEEMLKSPSELSDSLSDGSIIKQKTTLLRKTLRPFIFKLSDPLMIKLGVAKNYEPPFRMITLAATPSNPLTFWFQPRAEQLITYYPNNRICSQFKKSGAGVVYYENGDKAISFEFGRMGPLIIVYSKSYWLRSRLQKALPVAVFDLNGNGIVYDSNGCKRLVYDQAEGVLIDTPCRVPPLRWKWSSYGQVKCRRQELQFVPQTNKKNFDHDKIKAERDKKLLMFLSKKTKKTGRSVQLHKKKSIPAPRKHTGIKVYPRKLSPAKGEKTLLKVTNKSERKSVLKKVSRKSYTRSSSERLLQNLGIPKLLKFVGSNYIIKPLFTPCNEIMHLSIQLSSLNTQLDWINSSSMQNLKNNKRNKNKFVKKRRVGHYSGELQLVTPTRCKGIQKHKLLLKPIVMSLTENISLVIQDQQHIHIDFICNTMHYMFSIGVNINIDKVENIFDVRVPNAQKEPIPSVFEVLKMKCKTLYGIYNDIKNLMTQKEKKFVAKNIDKLNIWGQQKHFDKIPFCQLMDNPCKCTKCDCLNN